MSNTLVTLARNSYHIVKQGGFVALHKKRAEYYSAYPPLRKVLYFWLRSKVSIKGTALRNVNDYKMFLNMDDFGLSKHLFLYGTREPAWTDIMQTEVKKGMKILEIGANIGYYAVMESKLVGETGKIVALEPHPVNFDLLQKNLELNKCKNISAFHIAAGDKNEKIKIYHNKCFNRCNTFEGKYFEEIDSVRIDDFVTEQPDMLRMDVEGFEYFIVKGAINTLKKCKQVFVEIHPWVLSNLKLDYKEPIKTLFECGFKPKYIVKEYGPLRESSFLYKRPIEEFFDFIEEKELTPDKDTHGFGLFLVRE